MCPVSYNITCIIEIKMVNQYRIKLTCHHINRRHICLNIKSISVHPLLWMNVMLDFICIVFAELLSKRCKRKIQNDMVCLQSMPPLGIKPATPCFPACPSNHSAIGVIEDLRIKILQYLFTLRFYKNWIIVYIVRIIIYLLMLYV